MKTPQTINVQNSKMTKSSSCRNLTKIMFRPLEWLSGCCGCFTDLTCHIKTQSWAQRFWQLWLVRWGPMFEHVLWLGRLPSWSGELSGPTCSFSGPLPVLSLGLPLALDWPPFLLAWWEVRLNTLHELHTQMPLSDRVLFSWRKSCQECRVIMVT